jgi:hypothetical protein
VVVGLGAYVAGVALAARAYLRLNGVGLSRRRLMMRTLAPAAGAAAVACAAEVFGHRIQPLTLALALGCTLVVGLTLSRLGEGSTAEEEPIPFNAALVAIGLFVGLAFIATIGPGLDLSHPLVR